MQSRGSPFYYLGVTFGGKPKSVSFWDPGYENVRCKLAVWRGFPLSKVGRATLIKVVLSSILAYYSSIFRISVEVSNKVKKTFRRFLWRGADKGKGTHLIDWEHVTTHWSLGGLGIDNLRAKNAAFLVRWLWRFDMEPDALWRNMIKSKFRVSFICDHQAYKKWQNKYSPWKDTARLADFY